MLDYTATPNELVTIYLEMTPSQFQPAFTQANDIRIELMETPDVRFYRYLYKAVGEKYRWRDRLVISHNDIRAILTNPNTFVYVLYVGNAPAGYIELAKQGGSVEVAYFGLIEDYQGRGLGKHLLSHGVSKAFELGANRVWLHTCNLDGKHALANYQKRGFRVYQREYEAMPNIYQ